MQSPDTKVDSTDSVPGNKNGPSYIVQWPVDSVTTLSLHECQLNAGTLSDEDRQLFRKATTVVAMDTKDAIKDNMEIQILTDSHQYFVTSGDGRNKLCVFRDEKCQVRCRASYLGPSDGSKVIKIPIASNDVCCHDIHAYQINDPDITEEELALFKMATKVTSPMTNMLPKISVTILAEKRQFQFIPRNVVSTIIVQRNVDGKILCGLFGYNPNVKEAWEKFIESWHQT